MIALLLLFALGGLMHAARSFTTEFSHAGTQLAFGYLLLSSYFMGRIVNRLGMPKLTGYLMAGIISGPYVLELITVQMAGSLTVVSSAAIGIIALEAGAELHIKKIRPMLKTLSAITVFAVIGAMFVISGVLFAMRSWLPFLDGMNTTQALSVCVVIGVALSAQSPAVVMALLAETRSQGPVSSTILATVIVADLCVILCFSIATAITSAVMGGGLDVGATVLSVSWELFGSMLFGVAIGMTISLFLQTVKQGASLFGLLICIIVGEVGSRVHLDPLIIMLAAGLWLRNFSKADASGLLHGFESAQLPVFLVFFALAGSKLDIYALWSAIVIVVILAGVRAGSFFMGARFACAMTGAPRAVTQYAWFGLVPQAGLALALALVIAKNFPTFGSGAAVILFGVVGFNECIAPIILRFMLIRSGETGKKEEAEFAGNGPDVVTDEHGH